VTREDAASGQFVLRAAQFFELPADVRVASEPPLIEFRLVPVTEP
jgi:hypothetical protein